VRALLNLLLATLQLLFMASTEYKNMKMTDIVQIRQQYSHDPLLNQIKNRYWQDPIALIQVFYYFNDQECMNWIKRDHEHFSMNKARNKVLEDLLITISEKCSKDYDAACFLIKVYLYNSWEAYL
jgi:hypothetical protein